MARDRTARGRIRRHLAAHGPATDPAGLATKTLKEAVGYAGSQVAFIQLVAAMEREGELVRDVRGKRTYRIALAAPEMVTHREPAAPGTTPPAYAQAEGGLTVPGAGVAIDYAALARAVLHELVGLDGAALLEQVAADHRRIADERDAYAERLAAAHARLAELRAELGTTGSHTVRPPQP
jgi:hypothetical protein